MQKFLRTLLLSVAMLLPFAATAQNTLTVADGTTTNSYVPVYGLYVDDFVRCQTIYPAGEIASAAVTYGMTGGTITSLTYYLSSPAAASWGTADFVVNLMEVPATTLTGFVDMANATTVYTGPLDGTQSTMVVNFTTPYTYQGGNLLVEIYNTVEGTYKSASFYGVNATGASWQGNNGSSVAAITGATRGFIPKTTFTFTGGTEISCRPVMNLAISATTDNSITLTWSDDLNTGATYTVYNGVNTVASGVTSTTYTVTGLEANTVYTIGVEANCSPTDAGTLVTVVGRTACSPNTPLPYTEDFNTYEGLPTYPYYGPAVTPFCWNYYSNGTNTEETTGSSYYGGVVKYTSTSSYGSLVANDPYLAMIIQLTGSAVTSSTYLNYGIQRGDTKYAVLPSFSQLLRNLQISFDYKMSTAYSATGAAAVLELGYITDNNVETFQSMQSFNAVTSVQNVVDLNLSTLAAAAPAGARLAFKFSGVHNGTSTSSYSTVYAGIDNIVVAAIPSCARVTNLTAAVTSNSAILTWTDAVNSGATYSVYAVDGSNSTLVESGITGNTYTVTGLTGNTDYTFNVVTNCSATDVSMASTVSVHTDCTAETLPWSEDFSATLASDPCWRGASNATADEVFGGTPLTYTANNSWTYTSSVNNGIEAGHYKVNIYGTSCKKWMFTPAIDLTNATSAQLSFDVAFTVYSSTNTSPASGFESNSSQAFMVIVSTDGGNTWLEANATKWQNEGGDYTLTSIASSTYINQVINLNQYLGNTIKIAFYCQSTVSGGDNNLHLDNIAVTEVPSCPAVVGLHIAEQAGTTVTVAWNADDADAYEVEVRQNEQVVSGATVVVNGNSATISGLAIDNDYQIVARANCGNATSPWSSALNVHIGYCEPSPTSVDGSGITSVSFGGMTNTTHPSSASYADYTNMSGSVPAGTTATVDITYATGYTYGTIIWVDWDNSLSFDADEVVYAGTSENTNPYTLTASFDIPILQAQGNYRMRIVGADSYFDSYTSSIAAAAGANPCATYTWGVAEDYTLTVTEAPNCLPVYELEATNITANGVTLSWVSYSTGVTYTVTNGNAVVASNVTENSVNIINLQPNTDYTLAVTTMCPDEDSPAPRTVSFRTACAIISAVPYTESFEDVPAGTNQLNYCWTRPTGATYPYSYNGNARTGNRALNFTVTGSDSQVAALPQIDVNALPIAGLRLTMWAKGSGNLLIGTMSDPTDASTFTQAGTIAVSGSDYARYRFYDFNATTDSYIAIMVAGGEASQQIYIDDVVLDNIPGCWGVDEVTVSNITENGATLSWTPSTENGSVTFTIKNGTSIIATGLTGTSYNVTGLTANTDYELTVVTNCAANSASEGETVAFRTLCGTFNVPFTESFEASSNSISCWTVYYNNDNPMGVGTMSGTGNAALRFSSYSSSSDYNQYAFSPVFGGSNYDSLRVKVRYATYGTSDNLYFGYVMGNDTIWGSQAYNTTGQTDIAYYEANIPSTATQLAIHYYGNYAYYAWIDSVVVNDFVPVYNVNIATDDATHGTVNPSGTIQVYLGDRVTATATPAQGWHFIGWVDEQNNVVNLTNPYVFYPTSDMSLTATFEADPIFHTVTVLSANETMGTVAPAGANTVQNGNIFNATATANSGYHFVAWVDVNNQMISNERTLRFTVNADITVTATFEADPTQYTVNLSSANMLQGSVSPAGANLREEGSSFTATATPNSGYLFVAWTSNGITVSTDNPYTFQVTGNMNLVATFEAAPVYYTVNVASADAAMGTVAPAGANEVEEGTSFTVTATALNGYHFVAWRSGNTVVSTEASYTFTVNANLNLTATFEADPAQYIVTAISANTTMGEIDAAGNGGIYYDGEVATVLAVAHEGYRFVAWVDNANDTVVSTTAVYSFVVHQSIVLKATFAIDPILPTYHVTVATASVAMGSVDPEGTWEVTSGERFTVTATPRDGYEFVNWTVNGNEVSTSLTYIMEVYGDITVTANFRQKGAPVGIEDADLEGVTIYSADSRIVVCGAEGSAISVYDLSGRTLHSEANAASRAEFRMDGTGVYLVKVGASAAKRVLVVK